MSRRFALALAGIAFVAIVFAAPATASHSWGKYHWARTANPFTVKLGDNVTSAWDSYLNTASSDWSVSSVLDSPVVGGGTTGSECQPTYGRVEVCNAAYGANGWLGLAQIWITRGQHIAQGVTKMNDTYYSSGSKYDTPYWRGAVVCQEVGHAYGLDHQDESGADLHTCMDYASNPDEDNTHPNQHDYDQLVKIYSHVDRFNTASASGPTINRGEAPVNVVRNDRIKNSTITEIFADGSMRITYVVWALPSA